MHSSFRALIEAWPSLSEFATDLGVAYGTAKQMRRRDSINSAHWDRLSEAAKRRGIRGASPKALAQLAARNETARSRAA